MKTFFSIIGLVVLLYLLIVIFNLVDGGPQPPPSIPKIPPKPDTSASAPSYNPLSKELKTYIDKEVDTSTHLLQSYKLSDISGRIYTLRHALSRENIALSHSRFGYSKEALYDILKAEADRYNRKYMGHLKIQVTSPYSWKWEVDRQFKHLVASFKSSVETRKVDYLREHYFEKKRNRIRPDYRAIQVWQADWLKPVSDAILAPVNENRMSHRDVVKMIATLVQNLKYEIPPPLAEKEINGLWTPVTSLANKAGDCDSKSTLFATLYYHFKQNACILVLTKRHAFIGIKNMHKTSPRDYTLKIGGIDYLLIEATAIRRLGYISQKQIDYMQKRQFDYIQFH